MDKIEKIKELIDMLNNASYHYYVLSESIMENREWNELFDELTQLEEDTGMILANSPTQRAGFQVASDLPKVKHDIPLLSLGKKKQIPDLLKWLGNQEGVLMLKLDGGTGKIEYKNTMFQRLSTRGDSSTNIGEDVSHNVKSINGIPLKINDSNEIQIVGENYMTFTDFNRINNLLPEDDKYKHPRNLANGSVGLLDSKVCKERNIKFCAFNIIKGNKFKTKIDQLEWLKSQGFDVVKYWLVNKDNLEETIDKIVDDVPVLEFPIDGLVLSFNNIEYGLSLGQTAHHPNHSVSFKFEDSWYDTRYKYTEWNTSRHGKIVPTGIYETVKMDGADCSRATLNNLDIFINLQLGKHDLIQTSKRNKIIPKIEQNITRSNTEEIPDECPTCGGNVEIRTDKEVRDLYCTNPNCEAKFLNQLKHFVSKPCFNIEGLSVATLDKFVDEEFIESFVDIFRLDRFKSQIVQMSGYGLKSYNNLISSIDQAKNINLNQFLNALGIKQLGEKNAKLLCKHFDYDLDKIIQANINDFMRVEGFGEKIANSLYSYFSNQENLNMMNELLRYVNINKPNEKQEITNNNSEFSNKKVYATGTFANFKKDQIKAVLEGLGAEFAGGYAKSLDYLICGSVKGSSKVDKAIKDGIPVIMEDEFMKLIG